MNRPDARSTAAAGAASRIVRALRDAPATLVRRIHRRLKHGRRATIPHVSQQVRADLDRANASLERTFLSISRQFEPLTDRMMSLVDSSETLLKLASGRESGQTLFQRAVTVLHEPLEFIDRCVSQHTRLLTLLGRCEEEMKIMLRFQSRMRDLLAPLSFVEVLFKVESASLELEQRETFATVAADINHLRQLVHEAFEKNAGLLATTHATLATVRVRLEKDFRQHAHAISEKRQKIESALGRLDTQLVQNSRQETDSHALSRNLAKEVSAVVSALQYQDIIKQKCEHVVEALVDWEDHKVFDRAFVQVQAAQLEAVDHDIDEAASAIAGGLERIIDQGNRIDKRSVSMDDYEGMIASADGMVQMLLDAIGETQGIMSGTTALVAEAHEAARPAGNIAASLTSALGELSINMRLVALNAQVRSVQITNITGLEVLAVRTAEISNNITGVSREVSGRLVHLRTVTEEMFSLFDQFRLEGNEREEAMNRDRVPVEAELHQLRDQTLSVFQSIAEAVDQVRRVAGEAQRQLAEIPAAHAGVQKAHEALEAFGGQFCSSEAASDRSAQVLSTHAESYTMASERHVHEAVARGEKPVPGHRAEDVAPELFDEPATHAGSAAPHADGREKQAKPGGPVSMGNNVDLF